MAASLLLVANPTAQSGKNADRIDVARRCFQAAGATCDFLATSPDGLTIGTVQRALDEGAYTSVVSMGGDGTFREVASGLLRSRSKASVALGMLPTGTANDQGRSFGLSASPDALEENVAVILERRTTQLDAGHITALGERGAVEASAWFFDSAGWGLSARVLSERNRDRRLVEEMPLVRELYRDQLVYAGAFVRTFLESYVITDKFDAAFEADGRRGELQGLTDLVIKGTRVYGGAWVFDPTSRHDDGLFEVVPFVGKRDWACKALLHHDLSPLTEEDLNAIGVSHSPLFRFSRLELWLRPRPGGKPLAAQIDGEELPATPHVRVRVEPRALRLIVPQDHAT